MTLIARILGIVKPAPRVPDIQLLHAAIVTQVRNPVFYRDYGVPDTLDGRFDLLVLHVVLVVLRLQDSGEAAAAQALVDYLAADLDRNLREMGTGDMGVGKRMRAMGEAFTGRARAYRAALAGGEAALLPALDRNLFGTVDTDMKALALMAGYVQRQWQHLCGMPAAGIIAGEQALQAP